MLRPLVYLSPHWLAYREFHPRGQSVKTEIYKPALQCLGIALCRHQPEKWHISNWILHRDNSAHKSVTENKFLVKQHFITPTPSILP